MTRFKDKASVDAYLEEYRQKMGMGLYKGIKDDSDPGPESKLQAKCEKWLKDNGYPFLSFRQSGKVKTVIPAGWPDIVAILPGKVRFIELKAAKGRLSDEQKATRIAFLHLGHEIYEVRGFKRFLEVINNG